MPNKGEKVLRHGVIRSRYWYNSHYYGDFVDYEICFESDAKGSNSVASQAGGIFLQARLRGWWGLRISGWSASLRGNNVLRLARFGLDTLEHSESGTIDQAYTWSANTRYRMRWRVSVETETSRRHRVWVWVDGNEFVEGSPLINVVQSGVSRVPGYFGIVGGNVNTGCNRLYVYEDIVHSVSEPISFKHTPIQDRPAYDIYTHQDWKTVENNRSLELAYKGTRKTSGKFVYEPKLININKELPAVGSTNFSEYWNDYKNDYLPTEDFENVWGGDFKLLRRDSVDWYAQGGVILNHITNQTLFVGGVFKKLGLHQDFEVLLELTYSLNFHGGIIFRANTATPDPTCYFMGYTDSTFNLQRFNNSRSSTQLASVGGLPPGFSGPKMLMRLKVVGNNIKARRWRVFDPEPTIWNIDFTDANPITDAGYIGIGGRRTTGNTWDIRVLGIAWSFNNDPARLPVNTLVRWGEDKTEYGSVVIESAVSNIPGVSPADDDYLEANNWGIIPGIAWDLGTEGINKYLYLRITITRGTCDEESPASGRETDLVIDGDLCSTLLDDDVKKRYRKRICLIHTSSQTSYNIINQFKGLGYYIVPYIQDTITLSEIMKYDLCILWNHTEDLDMYQALKDASDLGMPIVVIGSTSSLIPYFWNWAKLATTIERQTGALTGITLVDDLNAKSDIAEISNGFISGEILGRLGHINTVVVTQPYIGEPVLFRTSAGATTYPSMAVEKGTLDLDNNPIGSRLILCGFGVDYSGSDWNASWTLLLHNCIRWALGGEWEEGEVGDIKIIVKDQSNTPIEGAYVRIGDTRFGVTNASGELSFINVPRESYNISIIANLYDGKYLQYDIIPDIENIINVQLSLITGVYVTQFGEYQDKSGLPFTPDEWESHPSADADFSIITADVIPLTLSGKYLAHTYSSTSGDRFAIVKGLTFTDGEIYCRVRASVINTSLRIWVPFRFQNSSNTYYVGIRNNVFEIVRVLSSFHSQRATASIDYALLSSTHFWIYVKVNGINIEAKLWGYDNYIPFGALKDIDPDYYISTTDTNFSSGGVGIGGRGTLFRRFSHFSVHNL